MAGQKSTLGRIIIKRTKTFLGKNVLQSHKSACRKPNIRKFMNGINLQHIYQQLFIHTQPFEILQKKPISCNNKCSLSGGRRCSLAAAARIMFSSGETSCSSPPISAGNSAVLTLLLLLLLTLFPQEVLWTAQTAHLADSPGHQEILSAPRHRRQQVRVRRWVTVQGEINFVAL